MRDLAKYGIWFIVLLLALACNRESRLEAILDGTGSLVLNIGSSTKAGTAADGDKMNNLHVWITDKSDKVVRYASWTGSNNAQVTMGASLAAATVSISNINRGEYNIYIIANAPSSLSSLPAVGNTIGDTFKKYVLKLPDGSKEPAFGEGGMPLTLISSVSISPGKNVLKAELVRVCGRLRVSVRNHTTGKNIFLQSVKLGALNPDRGYLFQQDGHAVPDGTAKGEFVSIDNAVVGTKVTDYIEPGTMKPVIDQYIFETGLNAVANMSLSFSGGIFKEDTKSAVVEAAKMDVYHRGTEFAGFYQNNIASADYFIIRNSGANYFLRSNGSGMKQFFFNTVEELIASDGVERFFWTFEGVSALTSGTGPSTVNGIKSVSEKKYINISTTDNALVTLSDKQQSLTIGTQSLGMLIRNGNYKIYCSYTTGDDVKSKINDADQNLVYWKMIPVTKTQENVFTFKGAEKNFHKNVSSIDYIDDFGVSVPLTDICRNEDVNVIINVFYNPEYASVYFEVSAWTEISNETTFD